jgi:hypothetical protein
MGNFLCCHDPVYELLDTKDQTYASARELTRQHKKKIKDLCNDVEVMNQVVDRIRTYIEQDTGEGEPGMSCPEDMDRDTWRAALQSQEKRIKTIHPCIYQVTSEAVYYSNGVNLNDIISRIRQAVLQEAERGKNYLCFSRPKDIKQSDWNQTIRYHLPTLKEELAGFGIVFHEGSSSISISW